MIKPNLQKNSRGFTPGIQKKPQANHKLAGRIKQPPFARTALDRLPMFFAPVVHLGDWNAAFADPRPAVMVPESADVTDFNWKMILKATPNRYGHKVIIVEAGRASESRIKSVASSLVAVGFTRVVVATDDGIKIFGGVS